MLHPVLHRVRQRVRVPDDLSYVFSGEGGLEWSFSPSEERYYSFRAGTLNSRITMKNLPNPNVLFTERCNKAGVNKDSDSSRQYRPTMDCFMLWNHKENYEFDKTGFDSVTRRKLNRGLENADIYSKLQSDKAKRQ